MDRLTGIGRSREYKCIYSVVDSSKLRGEESRRRTSENSVIFLEGNHKHVTNHLIYYYRCSTRNRFSEFIFYTEFGKNFIRKNLLYILCTLYLLFFFFFLLDKLFSFEENNSSVSSFIIVGKFNEWRDKGGRDRSKEEVKNETSFSVKVSRRTAGILESRNYEASCSHCDLRPKSGIGLTVYTIKYFGTGH